MQVTPSFILVETNYIVLFLAWFSTAVHKLINVKGGTLCPAGLRSDREAVTYHLRVITFLSFYIVLPLLIFDGRNICWRIQISEHPDFNLHIVNWVFYGRVIDRLTRRRWRVLLCRMKVTTKLNIKLLLLTLYYVTVRCTALRS